MDRENIQGLRSVLTSVGIPAQPEVEEGMLLFHPLLEKWNRRVRLVGSSDPRELALKHFADSLTVLPFLSGAPEGGSVLDVGSGAGFPGIPLALARPDLTFVLVESDGRKASFLVAAVAGLSLGNVKVVRARAEEGGVDDGIPACDFVVSRALTDPERWLPLAKAHTKSRGSVAAMMAAKAPSDRDLEALGALYSLSLQRVWRAELAGVGSRAIACWLRAD